MVARHIAAILRPARAAGAATAAAGRSELSPRCNVARTANAREQSSAGPTICSPAEGHKGSARLPSLSDASAERGPRISRRAAVSSAAATAAADVSVVNEGDVCRQVNRRSAGASWGATASAGAAFPHDEAIIDDDEPTREAARRERRYGGVVRPDVNSGADSDDSRRCPIPAIREGPGG